MPINFNDLIIGKVSQIKVYYTDTTGEKVVLWHCEDCIVDPLNFINIPNTISTIPTSPIIINERNNNESNK